MTRVFTRYMLKSLLIALIFISVVLAAVIFLTQSLRFLELVIEAGAAGSTFWLLTLLALPRFFEVILPIALAGAMIFIYHRMTVDSEISVLRASGFSPLALGKPALMVAAGVCVFLWFITMWAAPISVRTMQQMQQNLKAEFSSVLFQEGVFNSFGDKLTVYLRDRAPDGKLLGLIIQDRRKTNRYPVTVTAESGEIILTPEGTKVMVYNGSRQDYNRATRTLNKLDFERYAIDLPQSNVVETRWREPDERTFLELFSPDLTVQRDTENLREFRIEAHKRILSPLLAITLTLIVLALLLLGPRPRRGGGSRIVACVGSIILIQAFFLAAFNLSRQHELVGLIMMYLVIFLPAAGAFFMLAPSGERLRHRLLYDQPQPPQEESAA